MSASSRAGTTDPLDGRCVARVALLEMMAADEDKVEEELRFQRSAGEKAAAVDDEVHGQFWAIHAGEI